MNVVRNAQVKRLPGSVSGTVLNVRSNSLLLMSWIGMASIILGADYISGPAVRLPITYILPVGLAAWYNGRWWAITLAVALPLARLYFTAMWTMPWSFTDSAVNAAIRIMVLVGFSILIDRISQQTKALNRDIKVLEGVLPACRSCARILDEKEGTWHLMKNYIAQRSEARCEDVFCPECMSNKLFLEPPWKALRHMPLYVLGSRRVKGENYWDEWHMWYRGLHYELRAQYREEFPEPIGWKGFYGRVNSSVDADRDAI